MAADGDGTGGAALRPEIAQSWRRAELFGLDQDTTQAADLTDVDRDTRLMSAARPVLDALMNELGDEPVSLMLADRDCRMIYQRSGLRPVTHALEAAGIMVGSSLDEGAAGTNGLGTPLELGRAIAIHGEEHYLTALRRYSCYGHPIRHPLTQRVEGVLDITVIAPSLTPLVTPLLNRAVFDIEARIVEAARSTERRLFLAFQAATRKRSAPVAVLGGDVVLANRACLDRLRSTDPTVLRALVGELGARTAMTHDLDLGLWGRIRVRAERIEGTPDGVLFRLADSPDQEPGPAPRAAEPAPVAGTGGDRPAPAPVTVTALVAGELGSGRSHEARRLVGDGEHLVFESLDAVVGDPRAWAGRVAAAAAEPGALVVEDVHLLDETTCAVLRRALRSCARSTVVLTATPLAGLPAHVAALVALCREQVELPPLRERVHELPGLVRAMASRDLVLSPATLQVLANEPWTGNLAELATLVDELCSRPLSGRVGVDDLPRRYRSGSRTSLAGRQRAERAAVIAALREADGNKRLAAHTLGVSRTTLYRKMRELAVPEAP